jgi:hypothetical protein
MIRSHLQNRAAFTSAKRLPRWVPRAGKGLGCHTARAAFVAFRPRARAHDPNRRLGFDFGRAGLAGKGQRTQLSVKSTNQQTVGQAQVNTEREYPLTVRAEA